jgi:hypothetical protein
VAVAPVGHPSIFGLRLRGAFPGLHLGRNSVSMAQDRASNFRSFDKTGQRYLHMSSTIRLCPSECTLTYAPGGIPTGTGKSGTCWKDLEVVDPDPLNWQQKAWLTGYIQELHDNLHKTPISDYSTYIDLPTFIDYLLISELTRNVDAYVRSAYFFKERDGKLKAGPLWDYRRPHRSNMGGSAEGHERLRCGAPSLDGRKPEVTRRPLGA